MRVAQSYCVALECSPFRCSGGELRLAARTVWFNPVFGRGHVFASSLTVISRGD
jgi:hypothetical protein